MFSLRTKTDFQTKNRSHGIFFLVALCFFLIPTRISDAAQWPSSQGPVQAISVSANPQGENAFLPASADRPLLRIIYAANSHGALFPCPTCGKAYIGGMAKRATTLRRLQAKGIPVLHIVGAHEFPPDVTPPDPRLTGNLAPKDFQRIYTSLHPDIVYLSPAAARWFAPGTPGNFLEVDSGPVTHTLHVGGLTVAVILFPDLDPSSPAPGRSLMTDVLAAARAAANADIRIGVSPWGFQAEYSVRQALSQAFHLVLGAGPGAPFPLDAAAMAPALWTRAAANGRSLICLDLDTVPPRGCAPDWIPGLTVHASEMYLEQNIPDDPAMLELLHP